ncbi:probable serine/threonine-protein kinase WNK4, partial [Carica papaya]|uniref:probable serine/threonine-protein kinase WNK4 n=1 Tax=Carica papaya TaxID=3649 RepID=UPI000B8CA55B
SKSRHQLETIIVADDLLDDTSSQSSSHSGSYSNLNYVYGDEHKSHMGPTRRDKHPIAGTHSSTRFCPEESSYARQQVVSNGYRQGSLLLEPHGASSSRNRKMVLDERRLTRNRSLVDIRSQLLHRSLVEEVNKRRLFKTVGAVEDIGFQTPCDISEPGSQKASRKKNPKP